MSPSAHDTGWEDGLEAYAQRLRSGETTASQTVETALGRIAAMDGKFRAFVHVDEDRARNTAHAVDALRAAGVDLGPLMGVPVAVKDLFAIDGMPTRAGSRIDLSHAIGPEGPLIGQLKRSGAIILGKARMVEFAAGAQNSSHPTPWNPADPETHRSPGGSSNGSAVAVGAGFCPVAIGSDTGGSVRAPAALCGLVGFKASAKALPLDGAFPLCPAMDSVGVFASSVADAAFFQRGLVGAKEPDLTMPDLGGLRFGLPPDRVLSDLETGVATVFESALRKLERAGAHLVQLNWPDPAEIELISAIYAGLVPADLIATIGVADLQAQRDAIDPVALDRLDGAIDIPAHAYVALSQARKNLARRSRDRMAGLDAILQPTSPLCAPKLEDVSDPELASAFTKRALQLTRMANVYEFTACSIPAGLSDRGLPVGLDIAAPAGSDMSNLRLAQSVGHCLAEPA